MGKIDSAITWTKNFLDQMTKGTQIEVREVPVKDKQLFIECVKYFIDVYGDSVRFSNDYSRVIKES